MPSHTSVLLLNSTLRQCATSWSVSTYLEPGITPRNEGPREPRGVGLIQHAAEKVFSQSVRMHGQCAVVAQHAD